LSSTTLNCFSIGDCPNSFTAGFRVIQAHGIEGKSIRGREFIGFISLSKPVSVLFPYPNDGTIVRLVELRIEFNWTGNRLWQQEWLQKEALKSKAMQLEERHLMFGRRSKVNAMCFKLL
jgi:hypothetical protein